MHLMQKSKLFEYIDLRECTFDFALTDTFERIENHDGIVNVYVLILKYKKRLILV